MMELRFFCRVNEGGYHVVETPLPPGAESITTPTRLLVPIDRDAPRRQFLLPALAFRRFADVRTEDALVRFANGYGIPEGDLESFSFYTGENPDGSLWMEPALAPGQLLMWASRLRAACILAEAPDDLDAEARRAAIEQAGEKAAHPERLAPKDLLALLVRDALSSCALALIPRNEEVRTIRRQGAHTNPGKVRLDGFSLALCPKDLLQALWLQFALAVEARLQYEKCNLPGCDNWFESGTDTSHSNKRYCSDACRSKAWRRRKGS